MKGAYLFQIIGQILSQVFAKPIVELDFEIIILAKYSVEIWLLNWLVQTLGEEQEKAVGAGLSSLREEDVLVDTFAKVNLVCRLLSAGGFGAAVT